MNRILLVFAVVAVAAISTVEAQDKASETDNVKSSKEELYSAFYDDVYKKVELWVGEYCPTIKDRKSLFESDDNDPESDLNEVTDPVELATFGVLWSCLSIYENENKVETARRRRHHSHYSRY